MRACDSPAKEASRFFSVLVPFKFPILFLLIFSIVHGIVIVFSIIGWIIDLAMFRALRACAMEVHAYAYAGVSGYITYGADDGIERITGMQGYVVYATARYAAYMPVVFLYDVESPLSLPHVEAFNGPC